MDREGRFGYQGYDSKYLYLGYDHIALHLKFAVPKESPDFLEFNRIPKMAYYAYVLSPLTENIEKVALTSGSLYIKM